jgi:hypothetical protein
MSIVTMKRKSNAVHSNVSKNGFYLQGKLRQPPHNDIRTPTYTRFKGPDPVGVGSGSHCRVGGRYARICKHGYPITIHTDIYNTLQEVPNVSTMSNFAMLDQRFRKYTSSPLAVAVPSPSISQSEYNKDRVRAEMICSPMVGAGGSNPCNGETTKTTNKYIVADDTYLLKYTAKCVTAPLPRKVWHTNTLTGTAPLVD